MKVTTPLIAGVFVWQLLCSLTFGQQLKSNYTITPEPGWIDALSPVADVPAPESSGVAFVLVDKQVNVGAQSTYTRVIKRITSESGVQSEAQLQFSYEPSHEALEIHKMAVWRDGERLDRLSGANLRAMQQERDSSRYMYNGEEVVLSILEDIRVGDQIEYSYTLRGFNPIFAGRYIKSMLLQWPSPVGLNRIRVLWPQDRAPLQARVEGIEVEAQIRDLAEVREYTWSLTNLPAMLPEDRLPDWFMPYPWLQLSEFEDWAAVRDWALELYQVPSNLSAELEQRIEEVRQGHETGEARARAALRFVQDEVRYLGIEIGENSHKPHDPSLVFSRRFGDCKDKTVLLCAMLARLGIKATPALVNTYAATKLAERLPSPLAFNHVIAFVQVGGNEYWLDPTLTHQRGDLRECSVDTHGWALLVSEEGENLVQIPRKGSAGASRKILESLVFRTYDAPATLEVTSTYSGSEAEGMRRTLALTSLEELGQQYHNYYARRFPEVERTAALKVTDDAEKNLLILQESYRINQLWADTNSDREIYLKAHAIAEGAPPPNLYLRKMPLGLPFPLHVSHDISVQLPEKGNFPTENESVEDKFQRFRYHSFASGNVLSIHYEYEALEDAVPVSAVQGFLQNLTKIHELCAYAITFPSPGGGAGQGLHTPIVTLALLAVGALSFAGFKLHRYRPVPPVLGEEFVPVSDSQLKGLGGWLLLVGFGLIVSPIAIAGTLAQTYESYQPSVWRALTDPAGANYHPLWGPVLIGELLANLTLLAFSILLLVLFFEKRSTFPRLFIIFVVLSAFVLVGDWWAFNAIPALREQADGKEARDALRGVLRAIVWSAYMQKSVRVKNTFVN